MLTQPNHATVACCVDPVQMVWVGGEIDEGAAEGWKKDEWKRHEQACSGDTRPVNNISAVKDKDWGIELRNWEKINYTTKSKRT